MAKKVSKTLIGGFVVGAVVLIVAGVAIFGSGKFFKEKRNYVLFFQGSLKGLNQGSPVVFKGVKIGSVIDIALQVNTEDLTVQIPVLIETDPSHFEIRHGKRAIDAQEQLPTLIERGLRAQLQMQSFVTGQLIVGLDFHPGTPANLVGIETEYPEIPTIPTPLEQLSETLKNLPLEELVAKLMSAVEGIARFVNSPDLTGSITSLKLALDDTRKLVGNIDSQIGPLATGIDATVQDYGKLARNVDSQVKPVLSNVNRTVKDIGKLTRDLDSQTDPIMSKIEEALEAAQETLEQAEKTLAAAEADLSEDSPTMYELNNALREISAMARSIRQLADYLKRHPEALLSGKGEGGGE
jgi:paraquat-inducible protein B